MWHTVGNHIAGCDCSCCWDKNHPVQAKFREEYARLKKSVKELKEKLLDKPSSLFTVRELFLIDGNPPWDDYTRLEKYYGKLCSLELRIEK